MPADSPSAMTRTHSSDGVLTANSPRSRLSCRLSFFFYVVYQSAAITWEVWSLHVMIWFLRKKSATSFI
jgi:hypothetical protein